LLLPNNILTGLEGNDSLSGGNGDDLLFGGSGSDRLTGGTGLDQFYFSGVANFSALGIDTITDFSQGSDKIVLAPSLFSALSSNNSLNTSEFATITASSTTELSLVGTSSALLVYNTSTGKLFYNPDGTIAGLNNGGQFALLSNKPLLNPTDFVVQI
jgi:serralysin